MRFDIFTLFPEVFQPYFQASILQRAQERQLIQIGLHNIRDWTWDKQGENHASPYR